MKVVRLANYTSKVFKRTDCVVWFHCYTRYKLNFNRIEFTTYMINNAWNASKYGVFSGPYFPVFGQNTEIYKCIKSEYRKIRTRKNSVSGHFFTQWKSWKTLLTFLWCSFAMPWKVLWRSFRDLLQTLLLTSSEFKQIN